MPPSPTPEGDPAIQEVQITIEPEDGSSHIASTTLDGNNSSETVTGYETQGCVIDREQLGGQLESFLDYQANTDKQAVASLEDFSDSFEDADAEDEAAANAFAEHKKIYESLRAAGQNSVADDIEFMAASNAESARLRLRETQQTYLQTQGDDSSAMFFPDIDTASIDIGSDMEIDDHDIQDDLTNISSSNVVDLTEFMSDVEPEDEVSTAQNAPKKVKNKKVSKDRVCKPKAKKSTKKGARSLKIADQPEGLQTLANLLPQNIIAQAQANEGAGAQPSFNAKRKDQALKQLIASLPEDERDLHKSDKSRILAATQLFAGRGIMKPDGNGKWLLKGMNSSLHHYQMIGAGEMRKRENNNTAPFGGILADSMGLGKTILTVVNIVDGLLQKKSGVNSTLVVVPASLTQQWLQEIGKHARSDILKSCMIYKSRGDSSLSDPVQNLKNCEIVITSYNEVSRSFPKKVYPVDLVTRRAKDEWWETHFAENRGVLHRVPFRRIVLDEAQVIKNHNSKISEAVWKLRGKYRWALSGTPVQNRLDEFYSYFRFLNMTGSEDFELWKKNFCKRGSVNSLKRLDAILGKIMIRRTHEDKLFGRPILQLPPIKPIETIEVEFNIVEAMIYRTVKLRFIEKIQACLNDQEASKSREYKFIFSLILRLRQLTSHFFLVQKTLRDLLQAEDIDKLWSLTTDQTDRVLSKDCQNTIEGLRATLTSVGNQNTSTSSGDPVTMEEATETERSRLPDGHLAAGFREWLDRLGDQGSWAEVEARRTCAYCHQHAQNPQVTSCFHTYCFDCLREMQFKLDGKDEDRVTCLTCGIKFRKSEMLRPRSSNQTNNLDDSQSNVRRTLLGNRRSLSADEEELEWFKQKGPVIHSSKTKAAMAHMRKWWSEDPTNKIVIFFQFRGLIYLFSRICQENDWGYETYHGNMTFEARTKATDNFAKRPDKKVLLMSLHAGGVGLNLTAANRVIIVDLWWNESVESQAFCRVFRIGQTREVEVVRFAVKDTIDLEIIRLQERKTQEINSIMDQKNRGKLSTADLLKLFSIGEDSSADAVDETDENFTLHNDPYVVEEGEGYEDDNMETSL